MAGKYEAFRKLYPKAPMEATRFEQIQTVLDAPTDVSDGIRSKLRLRDLDNEDLCAFYVHIRKNIDELEAKLSVFEIQKEALAYLFAGRFEEADVTSIRFKNGVLLSQSVEPYPSVVDKEALMGWLKSTGQEELLTLNWQTLATITKQMLLEGKQLPPGVEVYMKQKLNTRGVEAAGRGKNE